MAYINAEKTAKIREQLKAAFPAKEGWKISLRNERHTSLTLSILRAPIRFSDDDYRQLNEYHLETYQNSEVLKYILSVLNGAFLEQKERNFDDSDSMTDYFHRGWYTHIEVGAWNKPFQLSN